MEAPIVKKIQKENDMSLVKFVGKEVKVQRQFLNVLEEADDQERKSANRRIQRNELNRVSSRCSHRKQHW